MRYLCIAPYAVEPEVYGLDFQCGHFYELREDGYMTTESGTDVQLSATELSKYFAPATF